MAPEPSLRGPGCELLRGCGTSASTQDPTGPTALNCTPT